MVIKDALVMFVLLVVGASLGFAFIELLSWLSAKLIGGIDGKHIGTAVAFAIIVFAGCLFAAWNFKNKET